MQQTATWYLANPDWVEFVTHGRYNLGLLECPGLVAGIVTLAILRRARLPKAFYSSNLDLEWTAIWDGKSGALDHFFGVRQGAESGTNQ